VTDTQKSVLTAPEVSSGHPEATHNDKRWIALGVIAVAQLMVVLDASIVTIALPKAQAALHISNANRQWVITAYTLAFGGLLLLGGRIADYVGRKKIFIIGLAGFAAASALGGIAQNAGMLFGARALQGAFAAILAPAALSLITVTFTEPKERATAFGVYGAISGGGAAVGLILGGLLTEYASWRWCLLVNVPIAIVTAIAAQSVVDESKAEGDHHYDIPGAVLVTTGLVALVYGFTEANERGWGSGRTVFLLIAAVVLLVGFVGWETRTPHALLPLRVPGERNRGGSFIASLLVGAGLFAMFVFLSYYFQTVLGYGAVRAGLAFLPFSLGIIVSAGAAAQILPKVGPRIPMIIGSVMSTVGILLLVKISPTTGWASHILGPEILMSVGLGLVFVPLASTALVGVADHDAGVASALVNATQQIGGSLGTALLNTISASALTSYEVAHHISKNAPTKAALTHSYTVPFYWGAGLLGLALVAVVVFIQAGKDDVPSPEMVVAAG
jgi:EmrB/QacA subfamily drug resistance transporter